MIPREQALRDAEHRFVQRGLPYFVRSDRRAGQRGLSGLVLGLLGAGVVLAAYAAQVIGPLVKVSAFLSGSFGLYITGYAVTDETYRQQELERAVAVRTVCRTLHR